MIQQAGYLLLGVAPMGRITDRLIGHDPKEVQVTSHRGSEGPCLQLSVAAGCGGVPGKESVSRRTNELPAGRRPGQEHVAEFAPGVQRTGVFPVQDDKVIPWRGWDDIGRAEIPGTDYRQPPPGDGATVYQGATGPSAFIASPCRIPSSRPTSAAEGSPTGGCSGRPSSTHW